MTAKLCLLTISALLLASALQAAPQLVAHPDPARAAPAAAQAAPAPAESTDLLGATTREKVEATPDWVQAEVDAKPDAAAAQALAAVEPGAEVTIYLGSWCGDSRREVPRFWKALDAAGGSVPFAVHYVAVDQAKKEPADLLKQDAVRYLPTIVVRRGGQEVGRIVETSPHGVEQDLLALLTGKATGVLSTRQDLAPAASHPQG
jgi:thiol-disulfide isomerase/thioredoxin